MSDEFNRKIEEFHDAIIEYKSLLHIDDKQKEITHLQLQMSEAPFWDDQKESSRVVTRLKRLKDDVDVWQSLYERIRDLQDLVSLSDDSYIPEIEKEVENVEREIEAFQLRILLSGQFDDSNAILEINAGAGGTEACDWAQMLFRMYFRWCEHRKFSLKVLDEVRGEEVGYKSITFFVEGELAYGYLKSEKGVHRLVRISPFDSNKRRHTSFVSVDVVPEIKEDIEVEIKQDDLRIDTFRSSGAGGQHVNVTDSAIRITHIPTGIVVTCQNERSQHQNKLTAMKVLKAKLYELRKEEHEASLKKVSGVKKKIEWGSQIRSYVLFPYLMVKDHRTNHEEPRAREVLEGKIDDFIVQYLKSTVGKE